MIKRIQRSLTLKWMIFSILLTVIPLAISGFNIIIIFQKDLKKSIIEIQKKMLIGLLKKQKAFSKKSSPTF